MDEDIQSAGDRVIKLTRDEYLALERALQWPEDLPAYDRSNTPTNFADVLGGLATI